MAPVLTLAANDAPIMISNLSPLAALRGLPTQRHADVQLGSVVTVSQSLSNHFTVEQSGDESLMLDGQTDVLSVSLRYGFDPDWDIEVTLPWVQHSRGFMDPTDFRLACLLWSAKWESGRLSRQPASVSFRSAPP